MSVTELRAKAFTALEQVEGLQRRFDEHNGTLVILGFSPDRRLPLAELENLKSELELLCDELPAAPTPPPQEQR